MANSTKIFGISGVVQHYTWGGFSYIPSVLKLEPDGIKPYAEYWLGAHDNAPAILAIDGDTNTLNELIQKDPSVLGEQAAAQFGKLPYLLKILDVKEMLSIQVHPSKSAAVAEFEAEEKKGIARNAPNRNYKDDNHKPELMMALSEFYLLHGFRSENEMKAILAEIPELNFLLEIFGENNYKELYRTVMEMPQDEVNSRLQPLLDRIVPAYQQDLLSKEHPDFWAARASITYNQPGIIDRGIFSVYLLNLVKVEKGGAVFQDAGLPHAYLEGQNIEIMANSDNVLRGGLTTKHVDVAELMKHVKFEATHPDILKGAPGLVPAEKVFKTPAKDFELSEINLQAGEEIKMEVYSLDIFLLLYGSVEAGEEGEDSIKRISGESFAATAGASLKIHALENSTLYRATVPY
ncbi:MAG: mannose-6-phosphate isomerase, class I [Flavitalea sp.]